MSGKWHDHWPQLEAIIMARVGPRREWTRFCSEVRRRLEAGYHEYGDGSFDLPALQVIDEMREEVLDLPGWGTILFSMAPEEVREDLLLVCLQAHHIYLLLGDIRDRLAGTVLEGGDQPPTCQYGGE